MKTILILSLAALTGCSDPYWNPKASIAVSEQKQIRLMEEQNTIVLRQTIALERIATAIENEAH